MDKVKIEKLTKGACVLDGFAPKSSQLRKSAKAKTAVSLFHIGPSPSLNQMILRV